MKSNGFVMVLVAFFWLDSNLQAKSLFIPPNQVNQSFAISKAQDSLNIHKSFRVEGGLGFGIAGEGGGLCGRLALSFLAMARITAFDGGEGSTVSGWFGPYRPVESFYDKGILLLHVISNKSSTQTIASAGVGWYSFLFLLFLNPILRFCRVPVS